MLVGMIHGCATLLHTRYASPASGCLNMRSLSLKNCSGRICVQIRSLEREELETELAEQQSRASRLALRYPGSFVHNGCWQEHWEGSISGLEAWEGDSAV